MNKGEIRDRILEQVDWNPSQSDTFKQKVDRLINRAYQMLCLEAPLLFFEDRSRIITQPDVTETTALAYDRVSVVSDTYLLKRIYSQSATAPTPWKFDGTFDGRMIEVKQADGTVIRRRCREFYQTTETLDGAPAWAEYISLEHQWPNNTDVDMTYRIFTPEYFLPADIIELRSARLYSDTHYTLQVSTQAEMERFEYVDFQGNEVGRPTRMFRGPHHQIDAPTTKPVVATASPSGPGWIGPEPAGKFDFCYTYVWGKRPEDLKAPSGVLEPLWESSPSPVSPTIEITEEGLSTKSLTNEVIRLQLPNVDQILNFFDEESGGAVVTTTRKKLSGLKKRIYIRRYTQNSPPAEFQRVEPSDTFFLLAEVDGFITKYDIDGSDIPDYYRRLKDVHGYQSIRLWPMPDGAYDLDLRVLRRPQELTNDTDAPKIHEEAVDALIQKALVLFYELQGSSDLSQIAEARYQSLLMTLSKRYGNISAFRPSKRPARARRPTRDVRVTYKA